MKRFSISGRRIDRKYSTVEIKRAHKEFHWSNLVQWKSLKEIDESVSIGNCDQINPNRFFYLTQYLVHVYLVLAIDLALSQSDYIKRLPLYYFQSNILSSELQQNQQQRKQKKTFQQKKSYLPTSTLKDSQFPMTWPTELLPSIFHRICLTDHLE